MPAESGCPSINSLPAPAVQAGQITVRASGSSDGSVTVAAQGVPAGDILVVAFETLSTRAGAHGGATGTVSGHPSVACLRGIEADLRAGAKAA